MWSWCRCEIRNVMVLSFFFSHKICVYCAIKARHCFKIGNLEKMNKTIFFKNYKLHWTQSVNKWSWSVQEMFFYSHNELLKIKCRNLKTRKRIAWHTLGHIFHAYNSNVVDGGFLVIFCFSAKHSAFRNKSKDWLVKNQDNMSEWSNMSTHRLLFQSASTVKILLSMLI